MTGPERAASATSAAPFAYRARGVLALLIMTVMVAVVATPLILLSPLLGLRQRFRLSNAWCNSFVALSRWLLGIRFQVTGREHIADGGAIYFSNHQSALETFYLQTLLPPYVWILKRELLRIPGFGWGLAALKPIAIDRQAGQGAIDQLVEQGRARLQEGLSVLVFPEGTRIPPGTRRRFKLGGAILATETGADAIPIAHNAGLLWPPKSLLPRRPGVVDVVIGPPLDGAGKTAQELTDDIQAWVQTRLATLGA